MPFALEFCKIALENVKLSLKIVKCSDSLLFFWIYVMRERKLKIAGCVTVLPFSLPVVPVFIYTIIKTIPVLEIKCDLFSIRHFRLKQSMLHDHSIKLGP